MNENSPFEAAVICYRQHPNIGESVNIGILIVVPEKAYIGLALEQRFDHLATLYKSFNPQEYEVLLNAVANQVAHRGKVAIALADLQQELVPQPDSQLAFSQTVTGTTDNPDVACRYLFAQLVGGPRPWHEEPQPQPQAQ